MVNGVKVKKHGRQPRSTWMASPGCLRQQRGRLGSAGGNGHKDCQPECQDDRAEHVLHEYASSKALLVLPGQLCHDHDVVGCRSGGDDHGHEVEGVVWTFGDKRDGLHCQRKTKANDRHHHHLGCGHGKRRAYGDAAAGALGHRVAQDQHVDRHRRRPDLGQPVEKPLQRRVAVAVHNVHQQPPHWLHQRHEHAQQRREHGRREDALRYGDGPGPAARTLLNERRRPGCNRRGFGRQRRGQVRVPGRGAVLCLGPGSLHGMEGARPVARRLPHDLPARRAERAEGRLGCEQQLQNAGPRVRRDAAGPGVPLERLQQPRANRPLEDRIQHQVDR
mmetsp:Transcript_134186/g.417053  ORF Transcript_134186/g.417053 Transcript_134186/m.417053 type:complete len:333 (-) Transcript_134186:482-1480(-)